MKRNRILALLLALVMLFALAACGQSKPAEDNALKESLESAASLRRNPRPSPRSSASGHAKRTCAT